MIAQDKPKYVIEARKLLDSLNLNSLINNPNDLTNIATINRLVAIFTNFSSNDGQELKKLFQEFQRWGRRSTHTGIIKNKAVDMLQFIGQKIEEMDIYVIPVQNIASANATLSALSNVNQSLNNIANVYPSVGVAPRNFADLLKNIASIQKVAGTSTWQEIANSTLDSPILNVVNNIQQLNTGVQNEKPENFLPEKLVDDIASINNQRVDKIFNFPAYKYIFNLEIYLRGFITKYVINPNKHQLASKIPQEMLNDWENKKNKEEENLHVSHPKYELIEYSDFSDLKIILEKRSTKTLVNTIVNEADLGTITSKLIELEPIRLKIAHSRALTSEEFNTLKIYSDKIKTVLQKFSLEN